MALDSNIVGGTSGNKQEVTAANYAKVITETNSTTNAANIGGVRIFSENDGGFIMGGEAIASPEVDSDYRIRVSQDLLLDEELFYYTAQNTGKHTYSNTTMTNAWTAGQLTTNSGSITTITTGTVFSTYATFPTNGTQTLSGDFELGFSAQPNANTFVEFGFMIPGAQTVAPTDGVFFRLSSAGLQGVASSNGTETNTGVFPLTGGTGLWAYTNNVKYQFIVYIGGVYAEFWVNDGTGAARLGRIPLPTTQGRMALGAGLPLALKHRITGGAAGAVLQAQLGAYSVRLGGSNITSTISTQGNRIYGSYQGFSGQTMGGLATYANNTNPTAAAPSNTALTANLPGGLGGQGAVIAAVAAATDGIWSSYQVPAGTVLIPGRRLVLRGVRLVLCNLGAAVAITATTIQFSIAYGHTNVSLATAESATTKAPRRIALGICAFAVGTAIGAIPQSGPVILDLGDAPIFINPGEHIALVGKFLAGTATASQVINFTYQPIYGWE